jgi:hypothetical protein
MMKRKLENAKRKWQNAKPAGCSLRLAAKPRRHSGGSRNPAGGSRLWFWTPAFAGVTKSFEFCALRFEFVS